MVPLFPPLARKFWRAAIARRSELLCSSLPTVVTLAIHTDSEDGDAETARRHPLTNALQSEARARVEHRVSMSCSAATTFWINAG